MQGVSYHKERMLVGINLTLRDEETCVLVKFDITPIKPMYRFLEDVSKALRSES